MRDLCVVIFVVFNVVGVIMKGLFKSSLYTRFIMIQKLFVLFCFVSH